MNIYIFNSTPLLKLEAKEGPSLNATDKVDNNRIIHCFEDQRRLPAQATAFSY